MKRIIKTCFFLLAFVLSANAVVFQKVTLKNGSVLNGYIQQQDGIDKMTFHTDNAVIWVSKDLVSVTSNQVAENLLPDAWKEWAKKNDALESTDQGSFVEMNDIKYLPGANLGDSVVKQVKVLEYGVYVKYLELSPNSYVISWKDIESIKADRRPKNQLSGINRTYQLRNGKKYEGQYAGESDNQLSLYQKNGIMMSFLLDDVVKQKFQPANPNQSIFEQSELIDIIKTTDDESIRGIIIEIDYSNDSDSKNYLLVNMESNIVQKIKLSDVKELSKEDNPKYNPIYK